MRRLLFVCYGNSIRSQLAEAMLNYRGGGRFRALSGGVKPAKSVHPMTFQALTEARIPSGRLKPKDWRKHVEEVDAVITLSATAKEWLDKEWPLGPEPPVRAHWEFTDPIDIDAPGRVIPENERYSFFQNVRDEIRECIEMLVIAPENETRGRAGFEKLLNDIGRLD